MSILWIKSFHLIAVIAWFAGLFYLPRIFVYLAQTHNNETEDLLLLMAHRLYYYIMMPAAVLASILGLYLLIGPLSFDVFAPWMHIKIFLVFLLWCFHLSCGYYLEKFKRYENRKSAKFFRFYNEIPTVILIPVILLVILKPF